MGGEAAHGVLVLSPKAVERLESYQPDRALPKIFQLTKNGKLNEKIFEGITINTPSMLCVEDALDGLKWAKEQGGLSFLINKVENNYKAIKNWVDNTEWIDFLCEDENTRSYTSVCFKIVDDWYKSLDEETQAKKAKEIVSLLEKEDAAYDIGAYRDAPAGLRIWAGATVEQEDLEKLFPWLEWAFEQVKNS
jgi:phosphoserine aminotransferase